MWSLKLRHYVVFKISRIVTVKLLRHKINQGLDLYLNQRQRNHILSLTDRRTDISKYRVASLRKINLLPTYISIHPSNCLCIYSIYLSYMYVQVVHALQEYTLSHYPEMPAKFGEILLRMPELHRVSQVRLLKFLKWIGAHVGCQSQTGCQFKQDQSLTGLRSHTVKVTQGCINTWLW